MTAPKDRPVTPARPGRALAAALPEAEALAYAKQTFSCLTCEWAIRPVGDECAEQEFVLGCVHWRRLDGAG